MVAKRTGYLLHWFDTGAHGLAAPLVEELAGPGGRTVFPELLKGFLKKVGTDGLEVVAQEIAQPEVLVGAEILAVAEQQPARLLEDRRATLAFHAAGFLGTDVVECLVHVGDDVEAVENVQRFGAVFADELQIGFPHVGADEYDFGNNVLAHGGEESLEGFDGSLFAYPEQAGDADINLVDQRQVLVTLGILDLVYSDGIDLSQSPVLEAPGDHVLDRIEDLLPGSTKRFGSFFPGHPAGPAGQEQHVGSGQRAFAIAPRDFFDDDGAAAAAIDTSHGVQQEDEESPNGDELETPLRELIVAGRGLMAPRADGGGTLARSHEDLYALVVGSESGLVVDESPEAVAAI